MRDGGADLPEGQWRTVVLAEHPVQHGGKIRRGVEQRAIEIE